MRNAELKEKRESRHLQGRLAFWRRLAIQQRWRRIRGWTERALEKLAEGG